MWDTAYTFVVHTIAGILSIRWCLSCCREFLDFNLSLPQDKVRETADTAVVHINAGLVELRRLFLVEDLIDSIKFAVCLWCLTYVGAIFNGMTLVILGKVFELKNWVANLNKKVPIIKIDEFWMFKKA